MQLNDAYFQTTRIVLHSGKAQHILSMQLALLLRNIGYIAGDQFVVSAERKRSLTLKPLSS